MGKYLMIGFAVVFFGMGFIAFMNGQPESRDTRVYSLLKPHIPYMIEKRVTGLRIRNTITDEKIEPTNADLYKVLDNLEKDWGEKHLRIQGDVLTVFDDKNSTLTTITLKNDSERTYIHNFFGL